MSSPSGNRDGVWSGARNPGPNLPDECQQCLQSPNPRQCCKIVLDQNEPGLFSALTLPQLRCSGVTISLWPIQEISADIITFIGGFAAVVIMVLVCCFQQYRNQTAATRRRNRRRGRRSRSRRESSRHKAKLVYVDLNNQLAYSLVDPAEIPPPPAAVVHVSSRAPVGHFPARPQAPAQQTALPPHWFSPTGSGFPSYMGSVQEWLFTAQSQGLSQPAGQGRDSAVVELSSASRHITALKGSRELYDTIPASELPLLVVLPDAEICLAAKEDPGLMNASSRSEFTKSMHLAGSNASGTSGLAVGGEADENRIREDTVSFISRLEPSRGDAELQTVTVVQDSAIDTDGASSSVRARLEAYRGQLNESRVNDTGPVYYGAGVGVMDGSYWGDGNGVRHSAAMTEGQPGDAGDGQRVSNPDVLELSAPLKRRQSSVKYLFVLTVSEDDFEHTDKEDALEFLRSDGFG